RVASLALDPPRTDHDPLLVERERLRVEEEDLPDLRLQRIELKRRDGRALVRLWHRQLQLDAVGALEQLHELPDILVGEGRRHRRGGGHLLLLSRGRSLSRCRSWPGRARTRARLARASSPPSEAGSTVSRTCTRRETVASVSHQEAAYEDV